jgi:hypothetical protein
MRSPIHTYGGRGAAKPNIVVENHAVIYTGDSPPALLPKEPATILLQKTPIRVEPEGHFLHRASRINFAKVHTLVMSVGKISEGSRHLLVRYFNIEVAM